MTDKYVQWRKDFKIALKTEEEIARFVFEQFGWKPVEVGHTYKYDLLVSTEKGLLKIEVKEDFTCYKTGNIGLEFHCREKPSGISVSEANLYVFKVHAPHGIRYIFIKTCVLRDMIERKMYHRVVNGGDRGSNSLNYLFTYYDVANNAEKIYAVDN